MSGYAALTRPTFAEAAGGDRRGTGGGGETDYGDVVGGNGVSVADMARSRGSRRQRRGAGKRRVSNLYYEHVCHCGHHSRAEPGHHGADSAWSVALSERYLAGPMLVALICALSLRMRLSRRRIQEFFADWFRLQLNATLALRNQS